MSLLPRHTTLAALALAVAVLLLPTAGHADTHADGLIVKKSAHSVSETLNRLEAALKAKGITIFARVPHDKGAEAQGLELKPTELLIFGNPKLGTPLMQSSRTVAIDLPMKAIAWQDEKGVWLAYNDPKWFAGRHGVDRPKVIGKITKALNNFTNKAVAP